MPSDDSDAPVTRARIAAHLARADVRARLASIVRHKTPAHRVEDAIAAVHLAILDAASIPDREAGIDPWMDRIAANRSVDEVRAGTRERARDGAVEDLDALPSTHTDPEPPESLDILPWLKSRVAPGSTDAETVAILEDKARERHTYARCAEAHGMTEAALKKRVARLVGKHDKAWQQHKRERSRLVWLVLRWAVGLVVAAAVGWVLWRLWPRIIPIGPEPPSSAAPVPSAGPPVLNEKDIARPPAPSDLPKPRVP